MFMGQFCPMEITPQCVVALTWTLKDTLGEELDVLDEPVEFLLGGNDLLPPIESALQGHSVGAKVQLQIEPEQAFGDFNDPEGFKRSPYAKALIGLALLWWLGVAPALRGLRQWETQAPRLEAQLQTMRSLQTEAQSLQAQPPLSTAAAQQALQSTLGALDNSGSLSVSPATLSYTANAASRTYGAANPAFSTLVAAVQAAGLVDTLKGPGPFTVFAPSNDAFKAVGEGIQVTDGNVAWIFQNTQVGDITMPSMWYRPLAPAGIRMRLLAAFRNAASPASFSNALRASVAAGLGSAPEPAFWASRNILSKGEKPSANRRTWFASRWPLSPTTRCRRRP